MSDNIDWIEGFDHYGPNYQLMLNGAYAAVDPGPGGGGIKSFNPRTGVYHFRIIGGTNDGGLRRTYRGDTVRPGVGYAFYLSNLPRDSTSVDMCSFRDINNTTQCSVRLTTDGRLQLCRGGIVDTVLATTDICVFANAYQHFEVRAVIDSTEGGAEIRMNGVTVLNVFDKNTIMALGTSNVSQVHIGLGRVAVTGYPTFIDIDDLVGSSAQGFDVNPFYGDKKVYLRRANEDTAQADWHPSIGSDSYPMVSNIPPDDNSKFLSADAAPAQTVMGLEALPDEVVSISAQMTVFRAIKTDAGNSKMKVGLISGSDVADGSEHSITQAYSYYGDVFENDPATDALWTVIGANAAQISIERTE